MSCNPDKFFHVTKYLFTCFYFAKQFDACRMSANGVIEERLIFTLDMNISVKLLFLGHVRILNIQVMLSKVQITLISKLCLSCHGAS